MEQTITPLHKWPRLQNNEPIFNNSQEAILYAQLIWKDEDEQRMLPIYRNDCREELIHQRHMPTPDLDRMMVLATKGQFFRECLEECQRINEENSQG